jgi:tetratricopeptide (TPR) repeat protein
MTDLEYINDFFSSDPTPEEKGAFEERISGEPLFAEEVAFFLKTLEVAKTEQINARKNQFRDLYQQKTRGGKAAPVKRIWYALAAAIVLGVMVLGYTFWMQTTSPDQLAREYIRQNYTIAPVTMDGSKQDSLQMGLDLYNNGRYSEAGRLFENLLKGDSSNPSAIKYAGLVYLHVKDYDKALGFFRQLTNIRSLYANPGKFFEAITLMERNGPGDRQGAKQLLQQVATQDLEGSEKAKEWLKKL